jgi:hypothetical protein
MCDSRVAAAELRREFRQLVGTEPQQALVMVESLVLALHGEAMQTVRAAVGAEQGWRDIGRALCLPDDAGILIRQAAAVLLGLPAADRVAEREMLAQASGEEEDAEAEDGDLADLPVTPEESAWAAAVDQFRRGRSVVPGRCGSGGRRCREWGTRRSGRRVRPSGGCGPWPNGPGTGSPVR